MSTLTTGKLFVVASCLDPLFTSNLPVGSAIVGWWQCCCCCGCSPTLCSGNSSALFWTRTFSDSSNPLAVSVLLSLTISSNTGNARLSCSGIRLCICSIIIVCTQSALSSSGSASALHLFLTSGKSTGLTFAAVPTGLQLNDGNNEETCCVLREEKLTGVVTPRKRWTDAHRRIRRLVSKCCCGRQVSYGLRITTTLPCRWWRRGDKVDLLYFPSRMEVALNRCKVDRFFFHWCCRMIVVHFGLNDRLLE